jgi:hypothetical protein
MLRRLSLSCMILSLALLLPVTRAPADDAKTPTLAKPPATAAAENPCLKYLPADAWLAGNIDLKAILAWMTESKDASPMKEMVKQYIALARMTTGIDPEKDIDYVTFFAVGDPEKDPGMLLVLNGSFTTGLIEKQMAALVDDAEVQREAGKNVYVLPAVAFAFPEGGTMTVGRVDLVKASLAAAKAKAETPKLLAATLARTDAGSFAWVAVKPKQIFALSGLADFARENPDAVKALTQAEYVSLGLTPAADGYHLSAQSALENKEAAAALHDYLAGRKDALLKKEGVNAFYLPLLIASDIETSDAYVRVSLKLTWSALQDLWNTKVILKPKGN